MYLINRIFFQFYFSGIIRCTGHRLRGRVIKSSFPLFQNLFIKCLSCASPAELSFWARCWAHTAGEPGLLQSLSRQEADMNDQGLLLQDKLVHSPEEVVFQPSPSCLQKPASLRPHLQTVCFIEVTCSLQPGSWFWQGNKQPPAPRVWNP